MLLLLLLSLCSTLENVMVTGLHSCHWPRGMEEHGCQCRAGGWTQDGYVTQAFERRVPLSLTQRCSISVDSS